MGGSARVLALVCALSAVVAAAAYTVDCNHDYTDCDTELTIANKSDKAEKFPQMKITGLADVILYDSETAVFKCKVIYEGHKPTCKWFKNGLQIQLDHRITLSENRPWHRLIIKETTAMDQGIYGIECIKYEQVLSMEAHLYVAPGDLYGSAIYHGTKYLTRGVTKDIGNVKIIAGDKIVLKAKFRFNSYSFIWFKDNDVISQDIRKIMINNETTASLTISNSKRTDTGVYFVVAKSENGYLSSFGDVLVSEKDEPQQFLANIEKYLPDDQDEQGEKAGNLAKALTSEDISMESSGNNTEINSNKCYKLHYRNKFRGLSEPIPAKSLEAEYKLASAIKESQRAVSTFALLSLNGPLMSPPEFKIIKPLESAVACCGAKLSFDCSFDIGDPLYSYVVWYIGQYKATITNHLFNVVCGQGYFMLFIKKLKPGMAGKVICELRQAWATKKSVIIKRAHANLVIVPRAIIQADALQPEIQSKLYFKDLDSDLEINIEENDDLRGDALVNPPAEESSAGYFLNFFYCRLDDVGLYFLRATRGNDMNIRVTVHRQPKLNGRVTVLQWEDCNSSKTHCWYGIYVKQGNGEFKEVGVTSRPLIEVNPRIDEMISIIIRITRPREMTDDSEIYIVPPPEIPVRPHKRLDIQPLDLFTSRYITSDNVIGAGTFGRVSLVQNNKDKIFYAAKFLKQKDTARRKYVKEFEIMNELHHPKLIQLVGFYISCQTFVFVMEFCWGGELLDRIIEDGNMKESDVVGYVKQICEGLEYMHKKSIIHVDLKLDNIVCLSPNSTQIKLIDFGMSRYVGEGSPHAIYGTLDYASPEALSCERITSSSDMWSLGVITYALLMPFTGVTKGDRSFKICQATYDYFNSAFDEVSNLARSFVDHLLQRQPHRRLTATQALEHQWIRSGTSQEGNDVNLMTGRQNLKSYVGDYRTKWLRAHNVVMAVKRLRVGPRQSNRPLPPG